MVPELPAANGRFDLETLVDTVLETYNHWDPEAVLLVGSSARSTARQVNDIDVCILGDLGRTRTDSSEFDGWPMHVVGLSADDVAGLLTRPHLLHWEFTRLYISEWIIDGIICHDPDDTAAELRSIARDWLESDDLDRFISGKLSYAQITLDHIESGEIPPGLPSYLAAARVGIHLFDANLLLNGSLYTGEKHIDRRWSQLNLDPRTYAELEGAFESGTADDVVDALRTFLDATRSRYEDESQVGSSCRDSEK